MLGSSASAVYGGAQSAGDAVGGGIQTAGEALSTSKAAAEHTFDYYNTGAKKVKEIIMNGGQESLNRESLDFGENDIKAFAQ